MKLSKEQLATEIASQIKELGMNEVFNEEFISKVQESISEKLEKDSVLEEEVDLEEDAETGEEVKLDAESEEQSAPETPVSQDPGYTPQFPSFLDKIEPQEFVIFDMNELSEGGVNLSNKQLRTFENPDVKKSIHQCWIEEGKKKAKVYVAKFEEIGDLEFDPMAGTSKFTEKRIDTISVPGEKTNPYADGSVNLQVTNASDGTAQIDLSSINVEAMMKKYIEDALRAQLNSNATMETPATNEPVQEEPIQESQEEKENIIYSQDSQEKQNIEIKVDGKKLASTIQEENEIEENELKMVELAMNESAYQKINAPEGLIESIRDTEKSKSLLVSKGSEVQAFKFEGETYYYPTDIISANKCYVKL